MYSTEEQKRMAGSDEFQANLQNAQMQTEDTQNSGLAKEAQSGATQPAKSQGASKDPQEFLEKKKSEYTRGNDINEKGESEDDRGIPEGLDPELAKQAMQGGDFGPKDLARYREMYDSKYSGGSGESGESGGSGGNGGSESGNSSGGAPLRYMKDNRTFADKAVDAAAQRNPVDFKALDQRIHDRPLYTQAQADIKHSETFGDTWSWDSAPKWNTERFKAGEQENRYEDVMKDNKYDD